MDEKRRAEDAPQWSRDALAILYTLGYLGMMGALMFFKIPEDNEKLLFTLAGIMSGAQLGIIKYYFDGSKGAEAAQQANIARSARTDSVVAGIAAQAPAVAAAVVANATPAQSIEQLVTPAPPLDDGTIPAKAVADPQPEKDKP